MSTFASDFMDKFDARWDEVNVLIQMAEQIGTDDDKYNVLCRAAREKIVILEKLFAVLIFKYGIK